MGKRSWNPLRRKSLIERMALSQDNSSKFLSEEEIDTVKEVFILSFAGAFGTALAHSVVEIYREYLRNPNEPKPEEANEPTDNSD